MQVQEWDDFPKCDILDKARFETPIHKYNTHDNSEPLKKYTLYYANRTIKTIFSALDLGRKNKI